MNWTDSLRLRAYPGGSDRKESACNAGDPALIPGWGRSPGEGNGDPTPVFLPGESHGQRSLAGHSPWSCKELDLAAKPPYIKLNHLAVYLKHCK